MDRPGRGRAVGRAHRAGRGLVLQAQPEPAQPCRQRGRGAPGGGAGAPGAGGDQAGLRPRRRHAVPRPGGRRPAGRGAVRRRNAGLLRADRGRGVGAVRPLCGPAHGRLGGPEPEVRGRGRRRPYGPADQRAGRVRMAPFARRGGFDGAQRVSKPWDEERGPACCSRTASSRSTWPTCRATGSPTSCGCATARCATGPTWAMAGSARRSRWTTARWFDRPEQFDQRRVRLADVDGSGTTDILYLHAKGVRVYFNQSGNGWSAATHVDALPALDNVAGVQALDLLGNGTACLVWSSPCPATRPAAALPRPARR